jgi:hypothetical protein
LAKLPKIVKIENASPTGRKALRSGIELFAVLDHLFQKVLPMPEGLELRERVSVPAPIVRDPELLAGAGLDDGEKITVQRTMVAYLLQDIDHRFDVRLDTVNFIALVVIAVNHIFFSPVVGDLLLPDLLQFWQSRFDSME